MERVNNRTIKKILIVVLIFMLLINFIFPNLAYAGVEWGSHNVALGSIKDMADSISTDGDNTINKKLNIGASKNPEIQKKIDEYVNKMLSAVKTALKNKFGEGKLDDETINKVCSLYQENRELIEVKCSLSGGSTTMGGQYFTTNNSFSASIGDGLTLEKIKKDIDEKEENGEEIEDIDTSAKIEVGSDYAATGNDPNGKPTVEPNEPGKAADELGGILLEPLFSLINFVADAITSNLGSLMDGKGLALTPEYAVLGGEIEPELDENEKYEEKYEEVEVAVDGSGFLEIIDPKYPNIKYTPEEIFAGEIEMLSIDFISGKNAEGEKITGDWANIRSVVSQWYQVLRMIAIIGLLSVLIYTGIKIIISANAKDKAKYKEWIINWIMAAAILFSMHIIMAFIISVTGEFSKLIKESFQGIVIVNSADGGARSATNLMGLVRFMIQADSFVIKVGYEVMYIALLVYTIKFTFIYLKRVLNMAFLTLIAPIVALTYPIDKINDGKAQGFDMWIKEYIFNALLQPMHLILYYVLVGSAASIAASNPIYGIVVLAFMSEAEKLLKKIFGFQKDGEGTVGGLGGAFAAGALASNIKNIASMAGKAAGKSGGGDTGGDKPELDSPKPTNKPGMDTFDDETEGESVGQRMLDAYDEDKFGTDEYDPAEREAMAREANQPESQALEGEDLREHLREQGWSEEEINDTLGVPTTESSTTADSGNNGVSAEQSSSSTSANQPSQKSIKEMKPWRKGMKAVGKKLLKPIWDKDKSTKENAKRLARKVGKGALKLGAGVALGTAAAAVQAGISITDGKYSGKEGFATFTAGMAGGRGLGDKMVSGIGGLVDTYKDGALSTDSSKRKAEIMARAQERFENRDDVIAFNKKNYPGGEAAAMERQRDNYLPAGVTDLKDMKAGMNYANKLIQGGMAQAQADTRAAATIDFKKKLESQGQIAAVRDPGKQKAYIDAMVAQAPSADQAKIRRQYENAFKSIIAFDAANG